MSQDGRNLIAGTSPQIEKHTVNGFDWLIATFDRV